MPWTKQGNLKGPKGDTGTRGSLWFTSTGVPGASGVTVTPLVSGAAPAAGDLCLDLSTGDVYTFS